jgi:hypothetical protein
VREQVAEICRAVERGEDIEAGRTALHSAGNRFNLPTHHPTEAKKGMGV